MILIKKLSTKNSMLRNFNSPNRMKIIKIISEWKKLLSKASMEKFGRPSYGSKIVEAIVEVGGERFTRHIIIPR